jgi:hypothetical protein
LRIALLRASAERDLDMLIAAHGPTLRLPAGISQHNVVAWRRHRAAHVNRRLLRLTPFRQLLAEELCRAWQAARAVRAGRLNAAKAATTPTTIVEEPPCCSPMRN